MKQKFRWVLENFERVLIMVIFTIILITIFIQIVSRWFFNSPLFFTEELSRYLFLWMVFLGFSYIIMKRECLSLEFVTKKFSARQKLLFDNVINSLSIVLFVFLGYWSIKYIQFVWPNPAPAMRFSLGIVFIIAPVSMLLCIIRSIERIVLDVKRLEQEFPIIRKE